jgi:hypothetical protein
MHTLVTLHTRNMSFAYASLMDASPITIFGVALLLYAAALVAYRLLFSPIATIPGPRLAALSQWYETYREMFTSTGGQLLFHCRVLHSKYGQY